MGERAFAAGGRSQKKPRGTDGAAGVLAEFSIGEEAEGMGKRRKRWW